MTKASPPTLVITDGGLPGLVCAAIEAERVASADGGGGCAAILMPWLTSKTRTEAQLGAISSQARFFGQEMLEPAPIRDLAVGASRGFTDSVGLLAAVEVARANGCLRIVWPAHYHTTDDTIPEILDTIAASVDRALLVGRIAMLDDQRPDASEEGGDPRRELTIDTPLVDLTDWQVADLVVDLDAPAYLSWWWRAVPGDAEQVAARERTIWKRALTKAGWVSSSPKIQVAVDRVEPAQDSGTDAES